MVTLKANAKLLQVNVHLKKYIYESLLFLLDLLQMITENMLKEQKIAKMWLYVFFNT